MNAPPTVEAIERAIHAVAAERFGPSVRRRADLADAIRAISTQYNDDPASLAGRNSSRRAKAKGQTSSLDLLARLLFFTVADLPKIGHPIVELHRRRALPSSTTWRVLDVGAGCGAQSFGLLAQLTQLDLQTSPEITIDAVDVDAEALSLMADVLSQLAKLPEIDSFAPRLRQRSKKLPAEPTGPYELILVGGLLAELPADRHLELVDRLLRSLTADGSLIIVEPALRRTARNLHQLRDAVIERELASVFAPCTHHQPCPALAVAGDWCHELRIWTPPPSLRQLAAATGLRRRDLKWSYLTLRRTAANVAPDLEQGWARVVSSQLRSKGKREVFLCSEQGRQRITRLNRDASEANEGFDKLSRGCLAQLSALQQRGQSLRVDSQTSLSWLDSFED